MTHPAQMTRSLRQAMAPDDTWLLVDTKADDTFDQNATINRPPRSCTELPPVRRTLDLKRRPDDDRLAIGDSNPPTRSPSP
jgi:hypothetical protein